MSTQFINEKNSNFLFQKRALTAVLSFKVLCMVKTASRLPHHRTIYIGHTK